ncbi:MAG: 50S ribosomal protein L6 [Panacagrimonas sp.]
MSRVAKNPIKIPSGVEIINADGTITVKGAKSSLSFDLPEGVALEMADGQVKMSDASIASNAMLSGTVRALVNNMVVGVTQGYERKLTLVGVGYRAQAQGKVINLSVGLSHPVNYPIPEGVDVETPTQTEIVIKGADKQKVGQVAADLRAFRPPEPYKGKGVRYADEHVSLKEAKKK